MRLIYLDIDGVLNSVQSMRSAQANSATPGQVAMIAMLEQHVPFINFHHKLCSLDQQAVTRVSELVEATDAYLIITSTHRKFFRKQTNLTQEYNWEFDLVKLQEYCSLLGLPTTRVLGFTPEARGVGKMRGHEIAEHLASFPAQVAAYVIIDDDSDMLPEQLSSFVRTSYEVGFTADDQVRATAILRCLTA